MAVQLDVPLLEITSEEFVHAWTRFELVASAKEWNETKQKSVLPTLLRGKLVDYFVELNDKTKADLQAVKQALGRLGITSSMCLSVFSSNGL